MPSVKNYKGSKKKSSTDTSAELTSESEKPTTEIRRPHSEKIAETPSPLQSSESITVNPSKSEETPQEPEKENKFKIEFPYSELLRTQAPQVFDFAESVVTDWKNDGDFDKLPAPHPLAKELIGKGLRVAKGVEKNALMVAQIGLEFVKSKVKK